jgi:AraC-like DNA-binding protein
LFQQLFPNAVLTASGLQAHFAGGSQSRLRKLLELLELGPQEGESLAYDCLIEALLWSVAEQGRKPWRRADVDRAVRQALLIMKADVKLLGGVAALAAQVGLSRAAFVRRFSAAVGLPPAKYLTWLRMRRAARLLVTTDAGLAAIADELGYSSEFTFSRAFRRWHGVSPGTYRQRPEASTIRSSALAA